VPAHYCGIYAHKPTWGIVPSAGHWVQPGPRTDVSVVGPMARSAADLELALGITAGPDEAETRAWRLQLPPPAHKSLGEFRVGILLNAAECEVDAQVQEAIASVGRYLEHEGVKVTWNARPDIDFGQVMLDATMMMRVASARTMPESAYDELLRERAALRADDDGPRARYVRGVTATHREWLQAHARRYALQKAWERFFEDVDVLLCPIASTVAPLHTTTDPVVRTMEVNGRTQPVFNQILWAGLAGVPYLPSTAVPAGRSPEGLPIGVQIIGRQYGDLTTIALARMLEQGFRAFEPPAL